MVITHRTGDEQQLPLLDLTLEEGLARPGALEQAALVPEHRPEHTQPAARRQHAGRDHLSDATDLLPNARARQRRDRGRVEVAMRRVIQEVAHCADAEPR